MSTKKMKILVVDDEEIARENVAFMLEKGGYQVSLASDGQEAIDFLQNHEVDLVLTDLRMKSQDGMAVLAASKKKWPETEVVVITGYASVDTAVEAMQKGAYHYLAKPVKMDELMALAEKAIEKRSLRREVSRLRQPISQVAQLDCNVLILGETGTGKEMVARVIHELSPRSHKRFVAFNCGAFTEELISSELFGHEKGAFTGASQIKKGLLELAEGGTVFFDEVGELSLPMQVKLLRFLQERNLMRVGGTEEIPVDVRILAATNKDLKKESEEGAFRMDLFYRLDVLAIEVPPLSERKEDIPLLISHFLAKHTSTSQEPPRLTEEVAKKLMQYEYPGNIRELENIAQRLLLHCNGETVEIADVVDELHYSLVPSEQEDDGWPTLEEHEKKYILEVLDEVEGNKSKAAKILNIDRVSLWRKIKRYGLDQPDS